MKLFSEIRLRIGRGLLIVMFVAPLLMAPRPAYATGFIVTDLIAKAQAAAQYALDLATYAMLQLRLTSLKYAVDDLGAANATISMIEQKWLTVLANARSNHDYMRSQAEFSAKLAAKAKESDYAKQYLCQNLYAAKAARATDTAADRAYTQLMRGWQERDSAFPKGNGPAVTRDILDHRCGAGTKQSANAEPITGFMPASANPSDESCLAKKPIFKNADIDPMTLTPSPGKPSLEIPRRNSKGGFIIQNGEDDKILFTAGRDQCYNRAGPNPRPPQEKELDQSDARTKMANYVNCKAAKSDLISSCFRRLADISRPDCSDPLNKDECAIHHQICKNAIAQGLELPEDVFGNCQEDDGEGLSKYHREWISYSTCLQAERVYLGLEAGQRSMEIDNARNLCKQTILAWEQKEQDARHGMMMAINGLQNNAQCFLAMQ